MGLGNFDMASFKPQRSGTAAALLTTAPKQEEKKSERLELRIRSDALMLFKEICEDLHTNVSEAIRTFISGVVSTGTLKMSVQNVRTKENGPIEKQSNGSIHGGKVNLHNKADRETWLANFHEWGVWLEVRELNKKYYRYNFKNGCALIVEEGIGYNCYYYPDNSKPWKEYEKIRYCLLSPQKEKYCDDECTTSIVDWLTKHAKEI